LGLGSFELLFRKGPPIASAFDVFNLERLDRFAEISMDADATVVMLGNSRLKYATFYDDEFSRLLTQESGRRIRVLRIVNNWAVFRDFQRLLKSIEELHPDVIVLQTQLLGQERALQGRSLVFRDYIDWLLSPAAGLWNPGNINQHDLQFATPCANDLSQKTLEEWLELARQWLIFTPSGTEGTAARRWAMAQAKSGVKVVILSIPRTHMIEDATGVAFDDITAGTIQSMSNGKNILFARFSEVLASDQFCDFSHVNAAGRDSISAWLQNYILGLVSDTL
jgi:hypothetical protein